MSTINRSKQAGETVQASYKGFKVMVFYGYYSTHLYIMNAEGAQVYAHKIGLGDPLERAREVIERELASVYLFERRAEVVHIDEQTLAA